MTNGSPRNPYRTVSPVLILEAYPNNLPIKFRDNIDNEARMGGWTFLASPGRTPHRSIDGDAACSVIRASDSRGWDAMERRYRESDLPSLLIRDSREPDFVPTRLDSGAGWPIQVQMKLNNKPESLEFVRTALRELFSRAGAVASLAEDDELVVWSSPIQSVRHEQADRLLGGLELLLQLAERWLASSAPDDSMAAAIESDRTIIMGAMRAPIVDVTIIIRSAGRLSRALLDIEHPLAIEEAFDAIGVADGGARETREQLDVAVNAALAFSPDVGNSDLPRQMAESLERIEGSLAPDDEVQDGDVRAPWSPGDPWLVGRLAHLTDGIDQVLHDKELVKKFAVRGVVLVSTVMTVLAALLRAMYL